MKEILFRGKRDIDLKWIEGYYIFDIINSDSFIIEKYYLEKHQVDPESVCQYTGLKDTRGNKIFEGDIVLYEWEYKYKKSYVMGMVRQINHRFTAEILLNKSYTKKENTHISKYDVVDLLNYSHIKIIGNKWDNPELLEKVK